jgi:hypothetical protein
MRKDDFIRPDERWARRSLFGQRRRRLPWVPITLILLLGAGIYALSRNDLRPALQDLWSRSWTTVKPATPDTPEPLTPLPLPAQPAQPTGER